MFEVVQEFLVHQPVMVVCLVLASGHLVGRLRFKGFALGSVTGVLFAGLTFGHFGFGGNVILQGLGFAFFMYVVGFEAGPRIFSVMLRDGPKYLVLALVIAAAGFVTALGFGWMLDLEPGAVSGALAGGMTTTPTLAAAQDAVRSGQIELPEGVSAAEVLANVTTGYAITYLVGTIGLIVIIKMLPRVLGLDLAVAAGELEPPSGVGQGLSARRVVLRAYRVGNTSDLVGLALRDAEGRVLGEARCVKIRRGDEMLDPDDSEIRIEAGDCVSIVGVLGRMTSPENIGVEIDDPEMLDLEPESAQAVVTRRDASSRTLEDLGVTAEHGCIVRGVLRGGVELEPSPSFVVQRGDVLDVTAPQSYLLRLKGVLGYLERDVAETDLLTFLVAVALGIGVGTITVRIGGIPIGLGMAGGVLLSRIPMGYLRSVKPTFGRVPSGARWFIMELGLLLFMAGVGLEAGGTIVETLKEAGGALLLTGLAVMVVPVLAGFAAGRVLFGMNPALLMGAITGAMTSTAAMRIVCDESRSSAPALGYTGAYALANIILAVAGYLMIRFEMIV